MNQYLKKYLLRGFIFSGLGPIVVGLVYFIISINNNNVILTGKDMLMAIVTSYVIAFVHAGSSTLPEIDTWSKIKAMLFQFISLYSVYTIGYLLNGWLPFDWLIFTIYTSAFISVFLMIWLIVVLSVRSVTKKLNKSLKDKQKTE